VLKSGARHEGTLVGTNLDSDAAVTRVTLKDSRDLSSPTSAVRGSFVLLASDIASCSPKASNGTEGPLSL
jgi:hypothetical protein